jgi:Rps23 Pro-64 3,4-dihydroxylase Tpa1-like proline 4-hydroxylase
MMFALQDHGTQRDIPFPHFVSLHALTLSAAEQVLAWFESDAPWRLMEAEFYQQYEINLLSTVLPTELASLVSPRSLDTIRLFVESRFDVPLQSRVDVTAHKLLPGQRIRIHNDYIPGAETHRVLIQLNRGWRDEYGGLLMLFSSDSSLDLVTAYRPIHNSCFGFSISGASHHAVSPIMSGERYTLVYSFH